MPRLRVLAGPTAENQVPITELVNSGRAHDISSDRFEGKIAVYVKGFTNRQGECLGSEYFEREDRKGITWSIQVQGRFLQRHSANDILFGNTFDKALKLPWGAGAALKFMKFIDPTLEHELTSTTKPWALSPLIATMPHFAHERLHDLQGSPISEESDLDGLRPSFPPRTSISDNTSQLRLASTSMSRAASRSDSRSPLSSSSSLSTPDSLRSTQSTLSAKSSLREVVKNSLVMSFRNVNSRRDKDALVFRTASDRRSHFSDAEHRKDIVFGPDDLVSMDFCYGYLEFSPTLVLRLPGGLTFDLMRYWDKHPVRFVCCERRQPEPGDGDANGPLGELFWCVSFELAEDDKSDKQTSCSNNVLGNPKDID
ncbi:hypothetical protein F5I97DRAFT_1099287 [Phlebopus sp. FC_14]|nr:hypothetical protein F5I97DRAFT_1099287 [Phlebopus sp. FC_14]